MCDVRNMSYVTKQSIRFVCHALFKSHSWHRTSLWQCWSKLLCRNMESKCNLSWCL